MRLLVVGGGGREHALVRALQRSPGVEFVLAAPGNPGIAAEPRARCVPVPAEDLDALLRLALAERIDLTIVGPEAPLVAGIVDRFEAAGLEILGPSAAAAALEGSKAFAKGVMAAAGVPTAAASVHEHLEDALLALEARPEGPVVIKADGLAAGKGVVVAPDRATAADALRAFLGDARLGTAGARVLIEDFLLGDEVSVIALCDGTRAVLLPPAQDHKRLGDGDTGPNTGGMGTYAPAPVLDAAALEAVRRDAIEPVLREMAIRGIPFHGFLFAGLMVGPAGVHVLEFNARLGDPETQVMLALLADDPLPAFRAAARGALGEETLRFRPDAHAACVVMAAEGYPDTPIRGAAIPEPVSLPAGTAVLHAGTIRDAAGVLRVNGGRVLGVTAVGPNLADTLAHAYVAVESLRWPGVQFRSDIGGRALSQPTSPTPH